MATDEIVAPPDEFADHPGSTDHMDKKQSPGRGTLALLCAVNFVVIMDAQIIILALPSIQSGLHFASTGSAQWVMSAYLLCFGGLLLLGGRAGDIFGHRKLLYAGTAVFGIASLACGLAPSPAVLIGARAVQGISAAAMAPAALAILAASFTTSSARNKALALYGAVGGAGATGALLIGGGLTSGIGWRSIFFINVPIALAILVLSRRLLTETKTSGERPSVDVGGAITLTGGLFAAIAAVVDAPVHGWSSLRTLVLLAAAVVLLVAFALIERRVRSPLLPPSLLRSRLLVGGNGAVFATGMCAWGIGLVSSNYAQNVLGYSPIEFGIASLALTLAAIVGAQVGQRLLPRLGGWLVVVTAVLIVVGCALLTMLSPGGSYFGDLFTPLAVFGLGLGTITMAGSVAALRDVEQGNQGIASGINAAAFQLGGGVGSAVVASIIASHAARTPAGATHGLALAAVANVAFAVLAVAVSLLLAGTTARKLMSD